MLVLFFDSIAEICMYIYRLILFYINLCCMLRVAQDDEAVAILARHFDTCIDTIVAGTWQHHPTRSEIARRKAGGGDGDAKDAKKPIKKMYGQYLRDLQPVLNYDNHPRLVWACSETIASYLNLCRTDVINSLARFDYKTTTPLIREVWPTLDLGVFDAGAPDVRGPVVRRPISRKRRANSDLDYKHGSVLPRLGRRRNLRAPSKCVSPDDGSDFGSGSGKTFEVQDILLEAQDQRSGGLYVYVVWKGCPLSDASWIPYANLLVTVKSWWAVERASRFPGVDYSGIRPRLFIASRPMPELIDDDSSTTEASVPPMSSSSSDSFEDEEAFECKVINERTVRGQLQFQVIWKGYPESEKSWILSSQLNATARKAWIAAKKS